MAAATTFPISCWHKEICADNDTDGLDEIIEGLYSKKPQIAADCIKVLYEVGKIKPEMIANHADEFIRLLKSPNNRLVWGGMLALSQIVPLRPKQVFDHIHPVLSAYQNGSAITRDYSISVFSGLCLADPAYEKMLFPKIITHLEKCRPKEVAQHAERAAQCVNPNNATVFLAVLTKRRPKLSTAQQKRVDKLIQKISLQNRRM